MALKCDELWSRRPWNERDTRRPPTRARTRTSPTARHRAARPRERGALRRPARVQRAALSEIISLYLIGLSIGLVSANRRFFTGRRKVGKVSLMKRETQKSSCPSAFLFKILRSDQC